MEQTVVLIEGFHCILNTQGNKVESLQHANLHITAGVPCDPLVWSSQN